MPQPFYLGQQGTDQTVNPDLAQRANQSVNNLFGLLTPITRPLGQEIVGPGVTAAAAPFVSQETAEGLGRGAAGFVEQAPRMITDAALAFSPGPAKLARQIVGLGDVALQGYSNMPSDATTEQRLGNAAIQAGSFAAAPKVAQGTEAMAGAAVRPLAEQALKIGPKTAAWVKTVGQKGGGYVGAVGALEAANAASVELSGGDYLDMIQNPEYIGANLIGGAILDAPGLLATPKTLRSNEDMFRMMDASRVAETDRLTKAIMLTAQRDLDGLEESVAAKWNEDQLIGDTSFGWKMREFVNTDEGKQTRSAEQMLGRLANLYPDEWSMFEGMGLPDYLKAKGKVTGKDVDEWVETFGPKVEVKPLYAQLESDEVSQQRNTLLQQQAALTHELETAGIRFRTQEGYNRQVYHPDMVGQIVPLRDVIDDHVFPPNIEAKLRELDSFDVQVQQMKKGRDNESATARYTTVNPKPLDQMEGAVDLLVRIPLKQGEWQEFSQRDNQVLTHVGHERAKYTSSHYPSEGKNLLAHVRGYMETNPKDGKRVFRVFEMQSDWAQDVRTDEARFQELVKHDRAVDTDMGRAVYSTTIAPQNREPLLKHYERLAIKSAIDHAIKNGADYIAVDDAETVMITEGHDRAAGLVDVNIPDAEGYISQAGGMRLHYDRTLPKIAEELTGQKGERVEFGRHQNVTERVNDGGDDNKEIYRRDLIFKNPDGTPKTVSTARLYSLDQAKRLISERGGIPLLGSKLGTTSKPKPLHTRDLATLQSFDSLGMDPTDLTVIAQALDNQARDPSLTFSQSVAKQLFGPNGPKLDEANHNPNQLLADTQTYLQHITKSVLKFDDQKSAYWIQKVLQYVGRVGYTQGETRLFPSETWTEDGRVKSASFYAPSRNELPNAFIGVARRAGVGADDTMFHIMHSIGHELFHGSLLQAQGKTFAANLPDSFVKHAMSLVRAVDELKLSTVEMEQSIDHMLQSVGGKKGQLGYRNKYYTPDSAGRQEYLADMFGLVAMSTTTPSNSRVMRAVENMLKFMPQDFRGIVRGFVAEVSKVWKFATDFVKEVVGWKKAGGQLDDVINNMKGLVKAGDWGDRASEAMLHHLEAREARPWVPLNGMNYKRVSQLYKILGAEGYDEDTMALVKEVSPLVLPQQNAETPLLPKRLKWWDYFKGLPQLVRDYGEFADMARLGRGYNSLITETAMSMWDNLKDPVTQRYDTMGIRQIVREHTPLNKAVTKVLLDQNSLETGKMLDQASKDKIPEYANLNKDDKLKVDRFLSQVSVTMIEAARRHVRSFKHEIGNKVALAFMSQDRTMKWSDAEKLGQAMTNLHVDKDRLVGTRESDDNLWSSYEDATVKRDEYFAQDPMNIARWALIEQVFTHEDGKPVAESGIARKFNEFRGKLLGDWKPIDPKRVDGQWGFSGKPGYTPEVRTGRWLISYREKDGTLHTLGYKNHDDYAKAHVKYKAMYEKGELSYFKSVDKTDNSDLYAGLRPDAGQAMADAVKRLNAAVLSKIKREGDGSFDEVINQLQDELKPDSLLAQLLEAPYMKDRALVAGREELNMAEGVVHYINSTAYTVAKRHAIGQQRLYLQDPQMRANPGLAKVAREYFKEIVDPTEKGFKFLKDMVALNYLFFSPSLAIIEGTQQLMNHIPALISQGVPIGDAFVQMKQANEVVFNAKMKGLKEGGLARFDDPELQRAFDEAVRKGIIDEGGLRELLHSEEDLNLVNSRNLFTGNGEAAKTEDMMKDGWYWLMKIGKNAHGMMIRHNAAVAFVTSFQHYRKQGLSYEDAFLKADDLTHESMHGGGRASRPLWFLGVGSHNLGAQVGGLMFMLQTYTYNTIAQQIRYVRQAVSSSDLTPSQRRAALTAGGTMVGVQLLLAGIQGIPFSGQVLALIEQLDQESQPKRRLRELFQDGAKSLFETDSPLAKLVSDAAWGGLANQVGPWDVSARFQLGGLMGVDSYRGFSWENMVGPVGGLTRSLVQDIQNRDAAGLIPNTNIKRLIQTASDGWDSRNKDERLNVDLTQTEAGLMALGFTPKRVKELQEYDQMKKRAERVQTLQQRQFHSELAALVVGGRSTEVRDRLLQHARESQGTYDPREGARRVAELVQARTLPFDPGRAGGVQGDSYQVNQLFERPQGQPTEIDRLQGRQELMQMMGFQRKMTRTELKSAQMIDYLVSVNPYLSRQEAKVIIERQMGRRF